VRTACASLAEEREDGGRGGLAPWADGTLGFLEPRNTPGQAFIGDGKRPRDSEPEWTVKGEPGGSIRAKTSQPAHTKPREQRAKAASERTKERTNERTNERTGDKT